ncbi:MAG: CvpA family protein [Bryobacterales bacterium]|nr:CvpA family protein [Bryobacterales bacterium]
MNWLDYILIIIVGASVISGFWRGFARTVVGILTTIAAVLIAIWFYGAAGSMVNDYVSHRTVANFLGFIAVFGLVMLAGALLGWLLARMFKWIGLGWLDRLLGAGAGLLRGALFATGIVLLLCAFTKSPPPQSVVESKFAPYVIEVSNVVSFIAPRELKDGFQASYEKVKKIWHDTLKLVPGSW